MDGVPMNQNDAMKDSVDSQTHIGLPPGARVEFIVTGPPEGETGLLVTRTVDTGPGGENDPNRMLAKIVASPNAPESQSRLQVRPNLFPQRARHGSDLCYRCVYAIYIFLKN